MSEFHEIYPLSDPTRPMVIIGSNAFSDFSLDDRLPYQYILAGMVHNIILIDGNNYVLHAAKPLIPKDIDLSLINAVVLPDRLIHKVTQEGLYYYSTDVESGGNYFGDRDTCIKRKATYYRPDMASVAKSSKLLIETSFIAKMNPSFLQIDIEGNDLELLVDVMNKQCRPQIIIYEYHYQERNNVMAFDRFLLSHGYSNVVHPINPTQNLCYVKTAN